MSKCSLPTLALGRKILFPLLALPLLGGCVEPQYLVARAANDPAPREETASLREANPHYTSHLQAAGRAGSVRTEIVRIAIDDQFNDADRAKILRAVNEWNHVLNGFVRLDIAPMTDEGTPAAGRAQRWKVVPARDANAKAPGAELFGNALAVTYPLNHAGGMVIVYVDRLGGRDLGDVIRHELGHVLGLGHDPHGHLMSAVYTPTEQQCIDKAAAEAIAANRALPAANLNWCEASTAAGKTRSDL